MSIVLGIDFSSLAIDIVGIHLDDLEPPTWTRYELNGQDAFDRTRTVAEVMPSRSSTQWDDVLAVGIEEPTGKFKPGLGYRVQGAVLSMIPANVLVKPWPPSAWRKACGLAGNASKEAVADWSLALRSERWQPNDWEQDACDAHCIALATRQAIEQVAA